VTAYAFRLTTETTALSYRPSVAKVGAARAAWVPPAGEVAIAAGFAAVGVLLTVGLVEGTLIVPALALTIAHSGVLAWRRRWPEAVLGVQGATAFAFVLAGWPAVGLGPAVVAGVHGLGSVRDRRRAVPVLLAAIASMAVVVTISDARADTVIANSVVLGVAWWIGDRNRRTQERALEAERNSDARARRAVAEERLRIARELHDIVAHALSVIAVQAGTGRVVLDRDPETTRAALGSIETQSRGALDEMRRLLAVLRSEDDGETGPLGPAPGLDELEALVTATVAGGLPVEVRIEGDRRPLPAGADLATYRIVQEALTNVRRHSSATRVEVRVAWHPGAVDLEILDNGHGRRVDNGGTVGHGLVGMRERAELYGGTFEAGDRPGGGFRVAAHIPCGEAG
jgi:signal transduction histidine kinase